MISNTNFKLTTTGKIIAFLGIFLVLAANNTGNNLLYLLAAGSLAMIVAALITAYFNITGLNFRWEGPFECFAGEELHMTIQVAEKHHRYRFDLAISCDFHGLLRPEETTLFDVYRIKKKRGCCKISDVSLTSLYPLGIFQISTHMEACEVWVFPQPLPSSLSDSVEGIGKFKDSNIDFSGDFWMQRPYILPEDAKHINWLVSARSEGEWVTVNSSPRSEPLKIWIDTQVLSDATIEMFLRQTTDLLLRAHESHTKLFIWYPVDRDNPVWISVDDRHGLTTILKWFAELEPGREYSIPDDNIASPAFRLSPGSFNEGRSDGGIERVKT